MPESLNAHQLIQMAQCLTRMQSVLTDYELNHYTEMSDLQKSKLEQTLTRLAAAAGSLYALSVQLVFEKAETRLQQLKKATDRMSKFLKSVQKIQQVVDLVGSVASLADAIISLDVEGIAVE